MSPERAKVLIAEDDPVCVDAMTEELLMEGHDVVSKATTPAEAEAMLSQIPPLVEQYGAEKVIVVLGGNLEVWNMPDDPKNDSQVILRLLKEQGLGDIRTVGFSENLVPGTTVDVGKCFGVWVLAEVVTEL